MIDINARYPSVSIDVVPVFDLENEYTQLQYGIEGGFTFDLYPYLYVILCVA